MGDLIDDLLKLSRVSRHRLNVQLVDVSEIVESEIEKLKHAYPNRNVRVKIDKALRAKADKNLLEIVVANLLGNAWKYTAKTEIAQIEFGAYGDKANPVFYVKDNGAGFDMAYAHNLFRPFQRLHSEGFEGTGIGLATVQRIIQRHGGRVWAQSKEGYGATFFFMLADDHSIAAPIDNRQLIRTGAPQ
jgi:light-regulated signal transduction histidine kinase (bacteriophytochrome)